MPVQAGPYKFGNDEAKAVAHADDVVRRAQGSGIFSDRSNFERGTLSKNSRQSDITRMFTTLASFAFTKFNIAYEQTKKTGRAMKAESYSPKAVLMHSLNYVTNMALLFTMDAVVMGAIKGQLPALVAMMTTRKAGFPISPSRRPWNGRYASGIRDVVSTVQGFSGGGAYGGFIDTIGKAGMGVYTCSTLPPLTKTLRRRISRL